MMGITDTSEPLRPDGLHVARPGTISTWSGRRVDPLDLHGDDICIEDIAHALARQCRYNGHCEGFISVARHSLWVSDYLRELYSPEMQLWGLLHDAAEAYIGDMVRPMKHMPAMRPFREADERAEMAIAFKFGLTWPMPQAVKDADDFVLIQRELPDLRDTYWGDVREDESDFLSRFYLLGGNS